MSIAAANHVYEQWALPGGVGVAGWEITQDVQAFLATAQMGSEKDMTSTVVATPAAAQVKGADGPDWVLACVLLDMRATITADARMGYGYCERMAWHAGRWMIASGTPPARAPSTWPGSDLSIKAGVMRERVYGNNAIVMSSINGEGVRAMFRCGTEGTGPSSTVQYRIEFDIAASPVRALIAFG